MLIEMSLLWMRHIEVLMENQFSLLKSFSKTTWFGFTGTPNFYSDDVNDVQTTRDISTHDIFGKRLHTYTIKDAIGDGNVLGFDITYFNPTIVIEHPEENYSEQDYEKKFIKVMFIANKL